MRWSAISSVVWLGCGPVPDAPRLPVSDVIEARCTACHSSGRMASGWDLSRWESAHALRAPISAALATERMPPWPAAPADVSYQHDRSLTEAERASLDHWLASDAPPWGDPPRALAPPPFDRLPRVDMSIPIAAPYTPTGVTDDVRCFSLSRPPADWITGARIVPDNRGAVHHARLLQASPTTDLGRLEAEDEALGWDCTEHVRTGGDALRIANWIPGYEPPTLPAGTGFALAPEAPLILVVHYWMPAFDGTPDRTAVELMLESGDHIEPIEYLLVRDETWRPGEGFALEEGQTTADHARGFTVGQLIRKLDHVDGKDGLFLHSAVPHMHTHGSRTALQLVRGEARTFLLDIDRWDFDWQLEYAFTEPVPVGPNDLLHFGCSYAGTGEPVAFGTAAEDEMCSLRLLVTGR